MIQAAASEARTQWQTRIGDAVFVALFAALVCLPSAFKILGFKDRQLVEKRVLAPWPGWPSSLPEWSRFPSVVEQYANDHFAMRAELISTNAYVRYRMGLSASPKILVGTGGWLYYLGDPEFNFIRGRNLLSSSGIDQWVRTMQERQKYLADQGARFLIFPAPIKETIYPEHLPSWLQRERHPTEVDQLVQAAAGRLTVIDVRKRLLERKAQTPVYTPWDSHWNAEGAFLGYEAIVEKLSGMGIRPLKRESITLQPAFGEHLQRDLVFMLGIGDFVNVQGSEYVPKTAATIQIQYLTERTDWASQKIIRTGLAGAPTLVILGDSYSQALLPYLEDTFGTIVWRHVQDGSFPKREIERYHPDVVLLEVQEAGLRFM